METGTIVYKVVRKVNKHLYSAYIGSLREMKASTDLQVEYLPRITTYPDVGKLFAFESLEAAQLWASIRGRDKQVWEALGTDVTKPDFSIHTNIYDIVSTLTNFWQSVKQLTIKHVSYVNAPIGTVLCSTITLLCPAEPDKAG